MRHVAPGFGAAAVGLLLAVATAGCGGGPAAARTAAADAGTGTASPPAASATSAATPSPARPAPATRPAAATPTRSASAGPRVTPVPQPTATRPRPAPRPPVAPSPPGAALHGSGTWKRAFAGSAGAITCASGYARLRASNTPRLTFGRTTVFVGFQQDGNNQDPVFARFDGSSKVYCEHHEHQSPDGRAMGITWDGGPTAYVVYTVVGGGSDFDAKARGGWIDRYGDGGGSAAVTVVGQVELLHGTLRRATFVTARLTKNGQTKTNTIRPVAAPLRTSGGIAVLAKSAFSPLNPDQSQMCASGGGQYPASGPGRADGASFVGVLTADLHGLTCARTWGCGNVRKPCPDVD